MYDACLVGSKSNNAAYADSHASLVDASQVVHCSVGFHSDGKVKT